MSSLNKFQALLIIGIYIFVNEFYFSTLCAQQSENKTQNNTLNVEYVVILVNNTEYHVKPNETLKVALGDKILIKDAVLNDKSKKISNINLVGFISPKSKINAEDRNFEIDTSKDLMAAWAIKDNVYKIDVYYNKQIIGAVFLEIITPKLESVTISINNKPYEFKTDDVIKLKTDDTIKIQKIKTNIDNPKEEENIEFQIVPITKDQNTNPSLYELRFLKNKRIFSWLLMQIEK